MLFFSSIDNDIRYFFQKQVFNVDSKPFMAGELHGKPQRWGSINYFFSVCTLTRTTLLTIIEWLKNKHNDQKAVQIAVVYSKIPADWLTREKFCVGTSAACRGTLCYSNG